MAILIKITKNKKYSYSFLLVAFRVLNSHSLLSSRLPVKKKDISTIQGSSVVALF